MKYLEVTVESRFRARRPIRNITPSLFLTTLLILSGFVNTFGVTFTGTNTGAIADGSAPVPTCGAARDISFAVSGISGTVGSASVTFTMAPAHTWVGDLQVSLIAPNAASHVIFSRVGANAAGDVGDNANVSGTYSFNDLATLNIWTVAASSNGNNFVITNGSYRTQAAGPFANDSPGPPFTSLNAMVAAVPPASVNGSWTLRFLDCAAGDTGTVSAASLTLLPLSAAPAGISGRVMTPYGAGIRNAVVTVAGGNLPGPMTRITNTFGYYRFVGLEAGQSYVVSVAAKRVTFGEPSVLVSLDEDLMDLNFVSN